MPEQEIFCPLCNEWFNFIGGVTLKPDVPASASSCGHFLPANSETRDIPNWDEVEQTSKMLSKSDQENLEALKTTLGVAPNAT